MLNFLTVQPSSSINFEFRLFDKQGKIIKLNEFCDQYKISNYRRPEYNFCNAQSSLYYDKQSKKIRLYTSTVSDEGEICFIHKKDTMAIHIINSRYGVDVSIDSLVFKPGRYAIKCNSRIVDGKTLPDEPVLKLKEIDYKSAVEEYYNFFLDSYKKLRDGYNYPNSTFRKIQRIYRIPKNDLSYKTAQQLGYK
jgi:hypothetical protein